MSAIPPYTVELVMRDTVTLTPGLIDALRGAIAHELENSTVGSQTVQPGTVDFKLSRTTPELSPYDLHVVLILSNAVPDMLSVRFQRAIMRAAAAQLPTEVKIRVTIMFTKMFQVSS